MYCTFTVSKFKLYVITYVAVQRMQAELANLRPQYEAVRHQLEAETLKRAEVENQLQTFKEQLTFTQNLHRTVNSLQSTLQNTLLHTVYCIYTTVMHHR